MRLLLDQNLSAETAVALRNIGVDVVHTREVGLERAPDDQILEWCRGQNRVAITRDADFHALLALSGETKPSVIRFRIEPLEDRDLVTIIQWIIEKKSDELQSGAAITVKRGSIRVHTLPLLSMEGEERV